MSLKLLDRLQSRSDTGERCLSGISAMAVRNF